MRPATIGLLRKCRTLPLQRVAPLAAALLASALLVTPAPRDSQVATPHSDAPVFAALTLPSDELSDLTAGAAAAFGTPSTVTCSGSGELASCAFNNLYLVRGRLRFLLPPETEEGSDMDADAVAAAVAAAITPFADLSLGAPRELAPLWPEVRPEPMTRAEFDVLQKGSSGASVDRTPILLYQRLQPFNIYHHVWDDAATVFALLEDWLPTALRQRSKSNSVGTGGASDSSRLAPLPVQLAFVDPHGGSMPNREVWEALSSLPAMPWESFVATKTEGTVVMLARVYAGTRGRCTHRRHCTSSPVPGVLRAFKARLLDVFGIDSTAGAVTKGSSAMNSSLAVAPDIRPSAVIIIRTDRRSILNADEVLAMLERRGYRARTVGPFSGMTLREQLVAVASSNLVVLAHGAELGPAWLGMREGTCAAVIFPFTFVDTFAWWASAPLGIRLAPHYDSPMNRSDPRLAKPFEKKRAHWAEIATFYQLNLRLDIGRFERSLWCM